MGRVVENVCQLSHWPKRLGRYRVDRSKPLTDEGQEHLFMIRDGDEILDAALAARGYEIIDPVTLYLCETARLRPASLPRAQSYCIWEPLHIMREIWAAGGIHEPAHRSDAPGADPKNRPARPQWRLSGRSRFPRA